MTRTRRSAAARGRHWVRFLFGAMICAWLVGLASAATTAQTSLWLRDPAISPDGSRIAFRFEGQIWIAPAAGGSASALTPSGFHAASPVWSPDGETIAFASDRFGPTNVFAAPVRGGEAKRLTWYSLDEWPFSFTPDGKSVLFGSRRLGDGGDFRVPQLFRTRRAALRGSRRRRPRRPDVAERRFGRALGSREEETALHRTQHRAAVPPAADVERGASGLDL